MKRTKSGKKTPKILANVMNVFIYLMDDHLDQSLGILHIHIIFWNSYSIHVIHNTLM